MQVAGVAMRVRRDKEVTDRVARKQDIIICETDGEAEGRSG